MDPEIIITLVVGSLIGIAVGLAYARRQKTASPLMKRISRVANIGFRGLAIGFGSVFAFGFSNQIRTGSEVNPSFAVFAVVLLLYGAGADRLLGGTPQDKEKH